MTNALKFANDLGRSILASVVDYDDFIGEAPAIKIIDRVDQGRWQSSFLVVRRYDDADLYRLRGDRLLAYPGIYMLRVARSFRGHIRSGTGCRGIIY